MLLRGYQSDGLAEIRGHLKSGIRSVLWQMPTGAGKTASTAHMLGNASGRGKRAWFMCHRRELILQSHRAFKAGGVQHGIIAAGFDLAMRRPVQICSVGTVVRRLDRLEAPDLIVWDECHHLAAGTWAAIYARYPNAVHIGLSATPERLDGQGLAGFFQRMVKGPSVADLIRDGYLSPYRMFAPSSPDLSGVHSRMGDFVQREVAAVMDKPRVTGDVVAHYRRLAMGRRALMFAVSIETSHRLVAAFNAEGIPAAHVDGETPADQRDKAIERLKCGQLLVVSNVDLFGEGVDLPAVEALLDVAPTMSLTRVMQRWGRVLRMSPGKTDAVILDHAGNCQRHGLPDDVREWSLEGADRRKKAERDPDDAPIKQCSKCYAISPAFLTACRECGVAFPIKVRRVEEVAGTLEEVEAATLRRKAAKEQAMAATPDALVELGRMRGYKDPDGWARHVWSARQRKRA